MNFRTLACLAPFGLALALTACGDAFDTGDSNRRNELSDGGDEQDEGESETGTEGEGGGTTQSGSDPEGCTAFFDCFKTTNAAGHAFFDSEACADMDGDVVDWSGCSTAHPCTDPSCVPCFEDATVYCENVRTAVNACFVDALYEGRGTDPFVDNLRGFEQFCTDGI
jgi:hypothetical protein